MCKKLFKALKIKMDNYKLRYELAGADEEILILTKENETLKERLESLKKANDSFCFITDCIQEYLGKQTICQKDIEDVLLEIKKLNGGNNGKIR